ncbi:hypothetical protein ACWF94_39060 [Streptomyces sp. NPDC055078]
MPFLVKAGIVELTVAVLSGWLMVYVTNTPKEKRIQHGVRDARRIRQAHLELLMMGAMITAIGAAVPSPPMVAAVVIVVCSWVAPLSFLPVAVRPELAKTTWMRVLDTTVFVGLSLGYIVLAVDVLTR